MEERKGKLIIAVLLAIVVFLIGIIFYTMVLKPQFVGYVIEKQVEAQQFTISAILQQIEEQGDVQLINGEGEEITLVAYIEPVE